MGSPYTGPEALKKGPLFIKKVATDQGPKAPPQGEEFARPGAHSWLQMIAKMHFTRK